MFELKKDKKGQFHWSIKSKKNGELIARSSESYATRASAMKSIEWMRKNVVIADITDLTQVVKKVPTKKK
jgi:uncharacterized protein